MKVVLLDNQDSFVYNLLAEFQQLGYQVQVFRNTVPVDVILAAEPDLICLSPGPGHPRDAGCMMELIRTVAGKIPLFGICLGFQALLEYSGGTVAKVGPVHGQASQLTLTEAGKNDPIFAQLAQHGKQIMVARYHSLGCVEVPAEMTSLARIGKITMAARSNQIPALGLQFHPESILTGAGPEIIHEAVQSLTQATQTA